MGFGVVREEERESDTGFTVIRLIVKHSPSLFLLLLAILYNRVGGLYISYTEIRKRDREAHKQLGLT